MFFTENQWWKIHLRLYNYIVFRYLYFTSVPYVYTSTPLRYKEENILYLIFLLNYIYLVSIYFVVKNFFSCISSIKGADVYKCLLLLLV